MAVPTQNGVASANTPTLVYQVDANKIGSVSLNILARGAVTVNVWISNDTTMSDIKLVERNVVLAENDTLLREPIVLPAGWRIYVQASVANMLSVNVWGIEGAA